jgi:hypothetical protein
LGWSIEYSPAARRHLKKLGRSVAAEILDYMDDRIATAAHTGCATVASSANWTRSAAVVVQAIGRRSTIYD